MKFLTRVLAACIVAGALACSASAQSALLITEKTFVFDGYKVWWTIVIRNPNNAFFARQPRILITARDADGAVIASKDKTFPGLPPGLNLPYGDDLDTAKLKPSRIDFTVVDGKFEKTSTSPSDYKPFEFKGSRLRCSDSGHCRITGDLFNPYAKQANLMATILFRDESGALVGGDTFFIRDVPPLTSRPFDDFLWVSPPESSAKMELYAFCGWTANWDDLL